MSCGFRKTSFPGLILCLGMMRCPILESPCSFTASTIVPVTLEVQDDRGTTNRIEREVAVDATRTIAGRNVTIPPAFVRPQTVRYEVEVLTGDTEGAGTDARVFLALYEKQEREGVVYGSGVMELTSPLNLFERGKRTASSSTTSSSSTITPAAAPGGTRWASR